MRRLLGLVVGAILTLGSAVEAAPAFVTHASAFSSTSATSTASSAFVATSGNLLVVVVRLGWAGAAVSGITDTAGNLYRVVTVQNTGAMFQVWYAMNITGHATNVVTAAHTDVDWRAINVAQFSGVATASVLDVFTWSQGATASALTSTVADAVIVVCMQVNASPGTWTAGTDYTAAGQDSGGLTFIQYRIVSAIQSAITPTATVTSGTHSGTVALAFNEPLSSGGGGETSHVFGQ